MRGGAKLSDLQLKDDVSGVDWEGLRRVLIDQNFHNGRTAEQLQRSFENSQHVVVVWDQDQPVGKARALSDGIGNAYIVDLWVHRGWRRRGIGTAIVERLIKALEGQHVYLQSDDAVAFFAKLGFREQPVGLSLISGVYLS